MFSLCTDTENTWNCLYEIIWFLRMHISFDSLKFSPIKISLLIDTGCGWLPWPNVQWQWRKISLQKDYDHLNQTAMRSAVSLKKTERDWTKVLCYTQSHTLLRRNQPENRETVPTTGQKSHHVSLSTTCDQTNAFCETWQKTTRFGVFSTVRYQVLLYLGIRDLQILGRERVLWRNLTAVFS